MRDGAQPSGSGVVAVRVSASWAPQEQADRRRSARDFLRRAARVPPPPDLGYADDVDEADDVDDYVMPAIVSDFIAELREAAGASWFHRRKRNGAPVRRPPRRRESRHRTTRTRRARARSPGSSSDDDPEPDDHVVLDALGVAT
jgi:hypothetical protein